MGKTMQTRHQSANESAATFKWLVAQLGLDRNDEAGPIRSAWNDVRTRMRRSSETLNVQTVD